MQWMVRCEVDGTVCILRTVPSLSEKAGGPRAKQRDEGGRRLPDVQVVVAREEAGPFLGRLELEVDHGTGAAAAASALRADVDADDLMLRDELDGPAVLGRACSWWGAVG